MFYVMILTVLLGALTHIHGAFAFALVPVLGLLACYAYTAVYGDWTHEETYYDLDLYVRVKVSDTPFFIVDRHGTKRVHWIEIGTNEQRDSKQRLRKQFTFTIGCFTLQLAVLPGFTENESSETSYHYTRYIQKHHTRRPMNENEMSAFTEGFAHINKAFDSFGKMFKGKDK